MGRRKLSAADIYCKFAAQLDEDGFRLYHAAQRITGFQPYDAFPYEDNRGAFEAANGHTLLRYLEAAHFDAVTCVAFRSCLSKDNVLGMMGIVRMLVAVFGVLTITPHSGV